VDALRSSSCSREALALALCVPFLCLHERYDPNLVSGLGSASLTVSVADLAALVVAAAAAHAALRRGIEPLRRGGWTLAAALALVAAVPLWAVLGTVLTDGYPFAHSAVSAAKFVEYGLLVLAVPLIVRRRGDALAVATSLTAVAAAASLGGVLQIVGLLGNLDNVPAGRRMPSFLGYHDFSALSGMVLGLAVAVIATGTWSRLRALPTVAAVAGALGVVISGALATVLATLAGGAFAIVYMVVRHTLSLRRALAVGGLLLVVLAGSLTLRAGDVSNYIGFLGSDQPSNGNIETYSQRTLLAYIGWEIFRAHPLTGVGWQASTLPAGFEPHLAAARRRFPDVPAQALPSASHRWGVQNAYVQAAADMGVVGAVLLVAALGSAFFRAAWRGVRGTSEPDPLAPGLAIAILVGAAVWAALGLVPGVPATALLWLAVGGAVALPRAGALPDDIAAEDPA
jgi:O-antigen ligase